MMIRTFAAALSLLAPVAAHGADLSVGQGQTYTTVQAAVNAAADGDTIVILGGTYVGAVNVPSRFSHLSIKAYGTDDVTIRAGQNDFAALAANSTHLRIKGIRLEASEGQGRRVIDLVNSTHQATGYFSAFICDSELVGNTSTSDIGVRAVNSAGAGMSVTFYSETLTGLNAAASGPLTSIWEDDMPLGIWEDDMPLGICQF